MIETFGRIAEKHGPWAVFALGLIALLYFVGKQFVRSLNTLTASQGATAIAITTAATSITKAVTDSAQAQIEAFGELSGRVSKMEGKVEGLALAAIGAARSPTSPGDLDDLTPVGGGPYVEEAPRAALKAVPAPSGYRPPSKPNGGKPNKP